MVVSTTLDHRRALGIGASVSRLLPSCEPVPPHSMTALSLVFIRDCSSPVGPSLPSPAPISKEARCGRPARTVGSPDGGKAATGLGVSPRALSGEFK